jgi:hypothetical protein
MKLWILDENQEEIAKALCDSDLDKQIKNVAQILCDVHHKISREIFKEEMKILPEYASDSVNDALGRESNIPLEMTDIEHIWVEWASECLANYRWLASLLDHLLWEQTFRLYELPYAGKYHAILKWATNNEPELRLSWNDKGLNNDKDCSPFPLVMPERYIEYLSSTVREGDKKTVDFYQSYRNYYKAYLAKIAKKIKCEECNGTGYADNDYGCGNPTCCVNWGCVYCNRQGYIKKEPVWTRRNRPDWI